MLIGTNTPSNDDFLPIPLSSLVHRMTLTLHHAPACVDHTVLFIFKDIALLVLFTLHFSLYVSTHVYVCVHVVQLLSETVSLFVAVMPLRCLPDSVVTPQVIFKIDSETQCHTQNSTQLSPERRKKYAMHDSSLTSAEDLFVMSLVVWLSLAALFI